MDEEYKELILKYGSDKDRHRIQIVDLYRNMIKLQEITNKSSYERGYSKAIKDVREDFRQIHQISVGCKAECSKEIQNICNKYRPQSQRNNEYIWDKE